MKRLRKRVDCEFLMKGAIFFPAHAHKEEFQRLVNTIIQYGGKVLMFEVVSLWELKGEERFAFTKVRNHLVPSKSIPYVYKGPI